MRVDATIPPTTDAMKELNKTYDPVTYAGAGHGFMRAGEPNNPAPAAAAAGSDEATVKKAADAMTCTKLIAKHTMTPGRVGCRFSPSCRSPAAFRAQLPSFLRRGLVSPQAMTLRSFRETETYRTVERKAANETSSASLISGVLQMKRKSLRFWSLFSFYPAPPVLLPTRTVVPKAEDDFQIVKVADGVYAAIAKPGGSLRAMPDLSLAMMAF